MKRVILIGCGKRKLETPAPAQDLYTGSLFQKSLAYARHQEPDALYILSALHGLVEPSRVLEPYDLTMADRTAAEAHGWGLAVLAGLCARGHQLRSTHFVVLAGRAYIEPIEQHLKSWDAPMSGLGIGERLAWLTRQLRRAERQREAERRMAA